MKTNEALQWIGAVFIILGHSLNSLGVDYHGDRWNIVAFFLGTVAFLAWTIRVANKPQMLVNIVAITLTGLGLFKTFG